MNKISRIWPLLVSLLFVVAVWGYWLFGFPAIMVFKEQIQMFLFNTDYLVERIVFPAGLARYVAEFLVQFFNNLPLGALIIALVMATSQLLAWQASMAVCSKEQKTLNFYLAFVPVLLLLFLMGNENVNFTFPVAVLFALLGMSGYSAIKSKVGCWLFIGVVTPLLYWAAGPIALMFSAYVAIVELLKRQKMLPLAAIAYAVGIILLSVLFVKAPFYRLVLGINYTLLVTEFIPLMAVVPACFVLVPLFGHYIPVMKKLQLVHIISVSLIALSILLVLPMGVEKVRYEVFEYDNLVRASQWDAIIRKAERKNPTSPLTVASLNIALAMKGQLTERAGQFFQNGIQGAFPMFNKNYLFSLMTSEVYFNVGLVNTAQRFAFEAMETIPDNNKSARIVKRLAETNLINGQYEVARKYLNLLKQTMFYSRWAQRTEQLLGNEEAIAEHPLYGYMRKVRIQNDFIFSEQEIDKIMGQLVMQCPENVVAQQYLLFLPMLEGNKEKYMAYNAFLQRVLRGDLKHDSIAVDTTKNVDAATGASRQVDGRTSATQREQ